MYLSRSWKIDAFFTNKQRKKRNEVEKTKTSTEKGENIYRIYRGCTSSFTLSGTISPGRVSQNIMHDDYKRAPAGHKRMRNRNKQVYIVHPRSSMSWMDHSKGKGKYTNNYGNKGGTCFNWVASRLTCYLPYLCNCLSAYEAFCPGGFSAGIHVC